MRFLIFSGAIFYPSGGWEDVVDHSASLDEAISIALKAVEEMYRWAHVVDTHERRIVWEGRDDSSGLRVTAHPPLPEPPPPDPEKVLAWLNSLPLVGEVHYTDGTTRPLLDGRAPKPEVDVPQPCSGCGSDVDCVFAPCPYAHDINGDDTKVWLCGNCRQQRANDI